MKWFAFAGIESAEGLLCPDCAKTVRIGANLLQSDSGLIEVNPDFSPSYRCDVCGIDHRDYKKAA